QQQYQSFPELRERRHAARLAQHGAAHGVDEQIKAEQTPSRYADDARVGSFAGRLILDIPHRTRAASREAPVDHPRDGPGMMLEMMLEMVLGSIRTIPRNDLSE